MAAAEIRDRETEVGEKIAATSMYLQTPINTTPFWFFEIRMRHKGLCTKNGPLNHIILY